MRDEPVLVVVGGGGADCARPVRVVVVPVLFHEDSIAPHLDQLPIHIVRVVLGAGSAGDGLDLPADPSDVVVSRGDLVNGDAVDRVGRAPRRQDEPNNTVRRAFVVREAVSPTRSAGWKACETDAGLPDDSKTPDAVFGIAGCRRGEASLFSCPGSHNRDRIKSRQLKEEEGRGEEATRTSAAGACRRRGVTRTGPNGCPYARR